MQIDLLFDILWVWLNKAFSFYRISNSGMFYVQSENAIPAQHGEVDKMKPEEKKLIYTFLDAFITKTKLQALM